MDKKSKQKAEGNPKAASTRIGSVTSTTLAGQIRHDLRRGPQPSYVDGSRIHLNRVIIEPVSPGQMKSICKERRELRDTSRAMKSNAAVASRGVITFGSEAAQMFEKLTPHQQDAALLEVARAVADRLATSLHGLVVHLDEATIHAHYQLAAYNRFGDPISQSSSPKVLSELQDIVAEIMGRHCPGIERGNRYGDRLAAGADFADIMHKSVKELHRTLPADLDAKRAKLAELHQAELDASSRVDEMRERVQKLKEKEDLSEKQIKRLATYEKRLSDRIADLRIIQGQSEAAKAESDRLANLARIDREKEEARAQKIVQKAHAITDAVASLAQEIAQGTITREPDGRIWAQDPGRLRAGYPEIAPAVAAGADLVMDIKAKTLDLSKEKERWEKSAALDRAFVREAVAVISDGLTWISEQLGIPAPSSLKKGVLTIQKWLSSKEPPEEPGRGPGF